MGHMVGRLVALVQRGKDRFVPIQEIAQRIVIQRNQRSGSGKIVHRLDKAVVDMAKAMRTVHSCDRNHVSPPVEMIDLDGIISLRHATMKDSHAALRTVK